MGIALGCDLRGHAAKVLDDRVKESPRLEGSGKPGFRFGVYSSRRDG